MADSLGGFTMRNRVINGCCRVAQRSSVSLTTSNQFGVVDRMLGSYVNGSAGTGLAQADLHVHRGLSIPFDPANTDYQQYLAWLAAGNTPLPVDGDVE